MVLTYATYPLACPDAAAKQWLADHFKLCDVLEFAALTWPGYSRQKWAGWTSAHLRDSLRPVKVNLLWWPNGASRFATFHGLVDSTQLALIRTATSNGTSAATLTMNDGITGHGISPSLFMLPPRPLADCPGVPSALSSLFLLTLVDARFFFWFKSASISITGGTTTWATLLSSVNTALGTSASVGPYTTLKPNSSLASRYEYLPLLLDAIAHNTGGRVVRSLAGVVSIQAPDTAKTSQDAQLEDWPKEAGGLFYLDPAAAAANRDFGVMVPASVLIEFGKVDVNGSPLTGSYAETKTLSSLGLTSYYPSGYAGKSGDVKIFHEDAYAIYDDAADTTPNNLSDLQTLATAMATAYYKFAAGRQSTRFAGIVPYEPEALSDSVEWVYEAGACYTLVQRGPWADYADRLNHWTSEGPGNPGLIVQELGGDVIVTGVHTVKFRENDGFVVEEDPDNAGVAIIGLVPGVNGAHPCCDDVYLNGRLIEFGGGCCPGSETIDDPPYLLPCCATEPVSGATICASVVTAGAIFSGTNVENGDEIALTWNSAYGRYESADLGNGHWLWVYCGASYGGVTCGSCVTVELRYQAAGGPGSTGLLQKWVLAPGSPPDTLFYECDPLHAVVDDEDLGTYIDITVGACGTTYWWCIDNATCFQGTYAQALLEGAVTGGPFDLEAECTAVCPNTISVTELMSDATGAVADTLTLDLTGITIPAGSLLAVCVSQQQGAAVSTDATVTIDGNPMTAYNHVDMPSGSARDGRLTLYTYVVPGDIIDGSIFIDTGGPLVYLMATSLYIENLASNAVDTYAENSGSASTPDSGTTGSTSVPATVGLACFLSENGSGAAEPETFSDGFTALGVHAAWGEVTPTRTHNLMPAVKISAGTTTYNTTLASFTPNYWAGFVVAFK